MSSPHASSNLTGAPLSERNLSADLVSGFFVFLIALPLCLGISIASGYPPIAGIFTAIIGGIVAPLISNSELTIKGPAAGLIAIAIGAITDFSRLAEQAGVESPQFKAYQLALAVGVASGVMQILFGLFRAGILVEFFPLSAVHGMLAAIGIIIFSKQSHIVFGQKSKSQDALHCLAELPNSILNLNPAIFSIGLVSLIILFGLPFVKHPLAKKIPAPLVVLLVAVPLGWFLGLSHPHSYEFLGRTFEISPQKYLVKLFDDKTSNLLQAITFPDFAAFTNPLYLGKSIQYVVMFALVGSLESLLSAKAIDGLDPWKRKTNFNRELLGVGVANTLAAFLGGLPMISEIVRSSANINNGARTRLANVSHGVCLLVFVALMPFIIEMIPMAALAAMLVYTGFRLASPKEFVSTFRIGPEQLVIFLATIFVTLATDLLLGIAAGILVKFISHHLNGVSLSSFFRLKSETELKDMSTVSIRIFDAAVFSNWIALKRLIETEGLAMNRNIEVDVRDAHLIDHSVIEKLHHMKADFENRSLRLELIGLEGFCGLSQHPMSARKRGLVTVRRLTIYCDKSIEHILLNHFTALGVTGYTIAEVDGAGRHQLEQKPIQLQARVRIEVLMPFDVAEQVLDYLEREIRTKHHVTACIENVMVLRPEQIRQLGVVEPTANISLSRNSGNDSTTTSKPASNDSHNPA